MTSIYTESFTPDSWNRGALKTLLFTAHAISLNKKLSENEVKHLKHAFITINGFPPCIVSQVINRVENEVSTIQISQSIINSEPLNVKQHNLILPYKKKNSEHALKT